ncbi:hypothetical protein ACFJGV_04835 [Cnuibacter sp. UC19_7]|uniref:hypothetical protein n=1 Tax=Cnuibacter sp. UC19_7 TaxID=3350166 RepID=UPI00366DA65C
MRSRSLRGLGVVALAAGVVLAGALPASAAVLPAGKIVPVSVDDPGSAFVGGEHPSISAEGRFVAFVSDSTLLPGANGSKQVYLRDLQSGAVTLISHRYDDKKAGGQAFSDHPAVSADGKFVAFTSMATDLVSATLKTNGVQQVYRWDSSTGAISLMSADSTIAVNAADRAVGDGIDISDDGKLVAFSTASSLEGKMTLNSEQVYVRIADSGYTMTISEDVTQSRGVRGRSDRPVLSPNGRWVAFESTSTELDPNASSRGAKQIYVQELRGPSVMVSQSAGLGGDKDSFDPDVSNGGAVSFATFATDLQSPAVTVGRAQAYVSDADGSLTLVSHIPGDPAAASNGTSTETSISGDGGTVLFVSEAADLAKTGGFRQVFQWTRSTNASMAVSVGVGTTAPGNAAAFDVQLSSDGLSAAFDSNATDLVSSPVAGGTRSESYAIGLQALVPPPVVPTPTPSDGAQGSASGAVAPAASGPAGGGGRLANTGADITGAGAMGAVGALLLAGGAASALFLRRKNERGTDRG